MIPLPNLRRAVVAVTLAAFCASTSSAFAAPPHPARSEPTHLTWMGHHWNITNRRQGGMAGIAEGSPDNVRVDAHGFLHLRIAQRNGHWTAAELKSADRLGFGTYQWVVEGDVYHMDPAIVLGLFLYGPAAHIGVDGENEIDAVEFSQWNGRCHCNADFAVFYPPAGHPPGQPAAHWSDHFTVAGEHNLTTVRMDWQPSRIVFTLMAGLQPMGTAAHVLKTATFRADATHIPQEPLPLALNLWISRTPPRTAQEAVIRSFSYKTGTD